VVRLASPGLKHKDGAGIVRARVQVDPAAAALPEEPEEPAAVPEPIAPPPKEVHDTPVESPKVVEKTSEFAPVPEQAKEPPEAPVALPAPASVAPLAEVAKDEKPSAGEAPAAQVPKIVSDDPARNDEALAVEVALAVETEMSTDKQWAQVARGPQAFDPESPAEVSDEDVEEVLEEPLAEEVPD
jgi:hypothetical protein